MWIKFCFRKMHLVLIVKILIDILCDGQPKKKKKPSSVIILLVHRKNILYVIRFQILNKKDWMGNCSDVQ